MYKTEIHKYTVFIIIYLQFVGKQLNPLEIKRMNEKYAHEKRKKDDDHEIPPFITAARSTQVQEVTQLVASLQHNLPGRRIYIYDLDLTKDQKKQVRN